MLCCAAWNGSASWLCPSEILRSRDRQRLAAAAAVGVAGVVVERNRHCTPVGNEQRTIRLVAAVVVDSSYCNTLPGLQERSHNYPGIYVSPRPYGGF
jgi:hypothetical protein